MEIKDLAGLSKPLTKLIEVVSAGIGALSKSYLIRKTADAKAYEIKKIAQVTKDNQNDLKSIVGLLNFNLFQKKLKNHIILTKNQRIS